MEREDAFGQGGVATMRDDATRSCAGGAPCTAQEGALDELLRAALCAEEEPPSSVQAALLASIRARAALPSATETELRGMWALLAAASVLLTAAAVASVNVLLPGTLVADAATVGGAFLAACAVVLALMARRAMSHGVYGGTIMGGVLA